MTKLKQAATRTEMHRAILHARIFFQKKLDLTPLATQVTLEIYDITGRLVETLVDQTQEPGIHRVRWNRKTNPSGVYFYRLKAGEFVETRKMVVVD